MSTCDTPLYCFTFQELRISNRATEPKQQKHEPAQQVGFLPIPERATKSVQSCIFLHAIIQKQTPFMILCPPEQTAEKWFFLQENAKTFSCRKTPFLLQKKALFHRKMRFLGGHRAGNCRKSQEGFWAQESRTLPNFHKILAPPRTGGV